MKISEQLMQDHESGDFGMALKGYSERAALLEAALRNVYEVWAGSEGIPLPETAVEAYLLKLIEQMRDEAKNGLDG